MTDRITVNTQSSIRIEAERIVYADPLKLESAPGDADLILVTHAHFDHFSPEDIKKAAKPGTVLVLPESMRADAKKAGIADIVTLSPGETREIRGVTVEAVAAYNIGKPMHPKKNGWLGYIVTLGGTRIYIAGDTDVTPEAEAVRCDIAMVPVGGIYTMNAKEAAALVNSIRPAFAIPTHYGSLVGTKKDGKAFADRLDAGITAVCKLQ